MACQDEEPGQKCKQRFKGIENFLRKVAYNLGNSPSQTEVKIISCIPIDVTDLQQKIVHLERQLELASAGKSKVTTVNTAQCSGPSCGYTPPACCDSLCPDNASAMRKSMVSFVCPDMDDVGDPIPQCCSITPPKRKLFKKKPKKNCTQLVYYTQTTGNPFADYKKAFPRKEMQKADASIKRPYVSAEIFRKQYKAERYLEEVAGSSQVSAPVCRDARAAAASPLSDVCSCCHGRFHDLDQDIRSYHFLNPTSTHTMPRNIDHSIYYDSSYYDLVPVKEKPDRLKKESERAKKREAKIQLDAMCWQNSCRPYPDRNPLIMNCILPPPSRCARRPHLKYPKRRDRPAPRAWCKSDFSKRNLVECGDTYIKRPVVKKRRSKTVVLKNAECVTLNVNDSECQTESSKSIQQPEENNVPVENKTEVTLNQIKSILQSVLTQVKTNNQVKNQTEEKDKKDEIIQKETQDTSQDRSRILNSFTYSPFAVNPYMASFSRPEPSGPCHVPIMHQSLSMPPQGTSLPISHFQNYPLFIHRTPAKQQQCSSCCHPGQYGYKSAQPKQTSTSELPKAEIRNKETESLIKEIYKSVAVNMNVPTNDTSHSDYNNRTPPEGTRNESGEPVVSNLMTLSRQVGSSAQKVHATANVSRVTSSSGTAISKPSGDQRLERQHDAKSSRKRRVHESEGLESDTATTSQGHTLKSCIVEETLSEEDNEDDDESDSESEIDSDVTIAPVKKTAKEIGKKGLLSKMFGSVFRKSRRKERENEYAGVTADESDASDSDYQTVYSQTAEKPSKHVRYAPTHPKPKELKLHNDHQKQSPNGDQNRNSWGDRQTQYQPSPDQRPRAITRRTRPPGIYFQNFEMRPTLLNAGQTDYSRQDADYMRNAPQSSAAVSRPPKRNVGLKLSKKANWMKKHDLGFSCGPLWKELILDS